MNLREGYARAEFLAFLTGFLPDFRPDQRAIIVPTAAKTIKSGQYLGRSAILDLDIFEFEHTGGQDKRISLTTDGFRIMKESAAFQALAVFKSTDTEQWRLSLMTSTPEIAETGKITNRLSNPKRYSFLLGPGAKINTPARFLLEKGKVTTFDELKDRFSIEVVNKDFYRQIATFFNRLTGGDVKLGSKKEHFDPELVLPNGAADKTVAQEFSVRLIGRLIFSWFLKQKKSDAGIPLLPEEFLSSKAIVENPGYYHMVLEKMFFEAMNKPVVSRRRDLPEVFDQIPFLNGGLFDPHVDDYYTDGQFNGALQIPDKWFKDLFEVLETYNFTIDENTVLDVDLSIDPEMLGRIFENLLAEINPDTGESARKSTGSYYTPRQIVEYMVDQSLIQYLITKTGIEEKKIEALATVDELDDESYPLADDEKYRIVDALNEVKIIDPACGSGAFPIGILQKIVFMLSRVDPQGQLWFDKKIDSLDPLLRDDYRKKFENENYDYIRKTGIIRDSIYGVDLQPIAVEVSKLRCFLTLIVDEDIDDAADNRGIKPLPNLEFKFVAANSLIHLPGVNNTNSRQQALFEEEDGIEALKKVRDRYFVGTGINKERIKLEFYRIQKTMLQNQRNKHFHGDLTQKLTDWDPFADQESDWFDPEWMFGISDGFDIVIANPPWVFSRKGNFNNDDKTYYAENYIGAKGKINLFSLFLNKGLLLTKRDDIVTMIIPNTFLRGSVYEELRKYLVNNTRILKIVDTGADVFGGVTASTVVLIIQNSEPLELIQTLMLSGDTFECKSVMINTAEVVRSKSAIINIGVNEPTIALKNKILSNSKSLSDYIEYLISGIQTWKQNKNNLISNISTSELHRPLIEGKDIERFIVNFNNKFILYDKNLLNVMQDESIFLKPEKIVIQRVSGGSMPIKAAIDRNKLYCFNSLNTLICSGISNVYVTAILNSKLVNWYYSNFFSNNSSLTVNISSKLLRQIPIPLAKKSEVKEIEQLVEKIISLRSRGMKSDSLALEHIIDVMIYGIYNFTPEEIKIIEQG